MIKAEIFEGKTMDYYLVVGNITVENTPKPSKYYEPILIQPNIDTINLIVQPNDVAQLRTVLSNNSTPLPSQHKKKLKLWWEGHNFGRSGDASNNTGDIVPPISFMKMNMYRVPKNKDNEVNIMFMTELPYSISTYDSPEMQEKIFQDEFKQWCEANIPDTSTHLYITNDLYQNVIRYEPDLAGHFESVRVSNNIYTDFVNMYLGKNLVDTVHPITKTIHFHDRIVTPNIYVGPLDKTLPLLSSVTYRSTSPCNGLPCIEFTSNKQRSGSQFVVLCSKSDFDSLHCIGISDADDKDINVLCSKSTGGVMFDKLNHSIDSVIQGTLYYDKLLSLYNDNECNKNNNDNNDNKERMKAFFKEMKDETFNYMIDNPLQQFEKSIFSTGYEKYGNTIYQSIRNILTSYITQSTNDLSSIKLFEPNYRLKNLGGISHSYSYHPNPNGLK